MEILEETVQPELPGMAEAKPETENAEAKPETAEAPEAPSGQQE
jgi:hypothetical protein